MLLVALALVPVVVYVIYWASQPSTRKHMFDTVIAATPHDVFQYIRNGTNLQQYHPTFYRVMDFKAEDKTTWTFVVEEDLGIMGMHKIPLTLKSFPAVSPLRTQSVHFVFETNTATVTVKLFISDHEDGSLQDNSKIEVTVLVEAQKIFILLMANKVTQMWVKALNRVKTILETDKTK